MYISLYSRIKVALLACLMMASCQEDNTKNPSSKTSNALNSSGFSLIDPEESGIHFNNQLNETFDNFYYYFNYLYNGAGVSAGDLDGDGLADLFFTGNMTDDKLYKNLGDFKFEDVTASSGIKPDSNWHTGVTMVDINGDGLLDIYVCRGEYRDSPEQRSNLLYINKGNMKFTEEAVKFGLDDEGYSMHANFFDADNDGDLDAFIMNRPEEWRLKTSQVLAGRTSGKAYEKDHFYLNDGNGNFKDVSDQSGFKNNYGYGLSCTTIDVNNDGFLDLYIANDFLENDYLYVNQGDGTFKEDVRSHTNHTPYFAMGTDIQDLNNDGYEEIFTVEMLPNDYWRSKVTMTKMISMEGFDQLFEGDKFHFQYMHNGLQKNNGNGFFSEISQYSGIQKTDWSWACLLSDLDNDGLRDIYVTNGYRRDVFDRDESARLAEYVERTFVDKEFEKEFQTNIKKYLKVIPENPLSNRAFKNDGDFQFSKVEKSWGLDQKSFSNGAATVDLDNDGDLDIVVNNLDSKAFVYRNDFEGNNFIRVKLNGNALNTQGIGAKIEVKIGETTLTDLFKTVRGYHSSVEPIAHFGIGENQKIDEIKVTWPDQKVTTITNPAINSVVEMAYSNAGTKIPSEPKTDPMFADVTDQKFDKPFVHKENYYMDFGDQVLLPHRLSENGPALCVGDINGDNLDDLFIGGASNSPGAVYIQNNQGEFKATNQPAIFKDKLDEDVGARFTDIDNDGDLDLYVVAGGFEFNPEKYAYQDKMYLNDGKGNFTEKMFVQNKNISGSVVTGYDLDNDGSEELFVGGRLIPNKYPMPATSLMLKNVNNKLLTIRQDVVSVLDDIGMVTSAVFADINLDGKPELILVGEWMPITILTFANGKYNDVTKDLGLDNTTGWWNTIKADDIDGDGDLDLIAGNLGLNYKFHASEEKPLHVYSDDFDENGTYDIVLGKYANDKIVPVRGRDCTSEQMPYIAEKFPTFRDYASADLNEVLDNKSEQGLHLTAKMFDNVILRNDGKGFSIIPLPYQAQLSPIKGIVIDDFDGDGIKDILTAGNMFGTEVETTRADAGVGNYLKGKGNMEFEPISLSESGFFVPYDVRQLEKVKMANGQTGILVASNDDKLRLFSKK